MGLLERARATGVCPPSLLTDNRVPPGDGFDGAMTKVLGMHGLSLAMDRDVTPDFEIVMKMTELGTSGVMKEVLEYRRCIVIAAVGASPVESASVRDVLNSGYLNHVKTWQDQILHNKVGGVDLLLHLLTNIKDLPVTKSLVKQSGMGKAIGSIEKHSICAGTPNQGAITERVQQIKSAWNASVKARKEKDGKATSPPKRQIQMEGITAQSPAKKPRLEEKKPSNKTFSSLLKKVSGGSGSTPERGNSKLMVTPSKSPKSGSSGDTPRSAKKANKRVKWADHFGGDLTKSRLLDSLDAPPAETAKAGDGSESWTDRKKRDRLKEKELLAKVKKAKLIDDDDEDTDSGRSRMMPTRAWRQPARLPDHPEATKPQLVSKEIGVQIARMTKVQRARYVSDDNVPSSPAPLTGIEQALDMTSASSAVVATMPFFVPQAAAPAPAVAPAPAPSHYSAPVPAPPPPASTYGLPPPAPQSAHEAATAQTVQSLGLPMFLVGQNVQALQTLASSPSLLSTLVEPNGMYDQPRLMSLVQTLSQNISPPQPAPGGQIGGLPGYQPPAPAPGPSYGGQTYPPPGVGGGGGIYGPASGSGAGSYGQQASSGFGGGGFGGGPRGDRFRGDSNSEGNLHISGYGPGTSQSDVIALFAPYVKVDEVVMKGTFAFVNTSDPMGAKQAREALNGALLGGMPVRINMAQRRSRDPNFGGPGGMGAAPPPPRDIPKPPPPRGMPPFGQKPPGFGQDAHVAEVRDDRGNPATKNLFVAGYGPGTSEQQLREAFGQYATIVGVITKGTFSFVNTSDKAAAVRAREALSSTMLNGGVLRINFAKETGRLGTSFDLTYGPGQSAAGGSSHYGRGY